MHALNEAAELAVSEFLVLETVSSIQWSIRKCFSWANLRISNRWVFETKRQLGCAFPADFSVS